MSGGMTKRARLAACDILMKFHRDGLPDIVTRREAHALCLGLGLSGSKFERGPGGDPVRLVDIATYAARKGGQA